MQKYPNNNLLIVQTIFTNNRLQLEHTIQVDMRKVMETSTFFEIQPIGEQPRNFHKNTPK